jgi:hypothetical protein
MNLFLAAMIGWCGTRYPGWFWDLIRHRPPVGPGPGPDPDPTWFQGLIRGLIGAVGGAGAVLVFQPAIAEAGFLGLAVTAFFGGGFLGSVSEPMPGLGIRPVR